ncbi:titin [Apis mellifera carnica]|nr:titin [Apis mellifera carnica]
MKEKKIIAPEVPKEIQLESLEKITEQKVEMHEATQKKEEIKTIEEKIEDIERKREEKVETEGMAEEKIKILEEKITEQEQEQKIETIEIMEENKIQSLEEIKEKKMEDLNVKKEKKAEAIPKTEESLQTEKIEILSEKTNEIIKKEEEIEALIKTKEEIIEKKEIVEGKIIEEDKKIEILEKKEKVEEQVQEKKEIEITKADEIKIEEESERVEENEENTEKKKVIEIKEYSDETVSPKVEKEIIESLIEKIEEQKEIEESHERIEKEQIQKEQKIVAILEKTKEENLEILPQEDEELTQKQKKFEKTELIIKKEESVEILAEKIEELAIKEEKVDILSETPQELEKIVEKVEVSPEDNQISLIKEEKPEILIAKTEEIIKVPDSQMTLSEETKQLINKEEKSEEQEEIRKPADEEIEKQTSSEIEIEKSKKIEEILNQETKIKESKKSELLTEEQNIEKIQIEKKIEESSDKIKDEIQKDESTELTTKKDKEIVKQEEMIETLTEKIEELTKIEEEAKQERREEAKINFIQNTALSINIMQQSFKELTNLVSVALEEPLSSRSEEEKRRIRELTALIQILYDLKATSTSTRNTLSSSSIPELEVQFIRLLDTLINVEQATEKILYLTQKDLAPALKENVMVSLQVLLEPLKSLQHELSSLQQTTLQLPMEYFFLSTNAQSVNEIISELVKVILKTAEMKSMKVVEEIKVMKSKEENLNIEETTAKPLEELIEVLMVSQEQVKPVSLIDSVSPSIESVELIEQQALISEEEIKLDTYLMEQIVSPVQNLREMIAKIEEQTLEETETLDLPTKKTAAVILSNIIHPLEKLEQSLNVSVQQQALATEEITEEIRQPVQSLQSIPMANVLEELKRSIVMIQEEMILETSEEMKNSEGKAQITNEIQQSLENLKFSVGAVQKVIMEVESVNTVSNIEKALAIQSFVESMKELGDKCMAIVSQSTVKVKVSEKIQKEELEQVLEVMVQPIQLLRETAVEIEEQKVEEIQNLDETNKDIVEVLKPLIHPLEELEELLCTAVREVSASEIKTAEEVKKTAGELKLSPVLEKLQKSIAVIEEQTAHATEKTRCVCHKSGSIRC